MSKRRGIGVAAIAAGLIVLALSWGSLATAYIPDSTPSIDDIVGFYVGTANLVEYDAATGNQQHFTDKGTYTITKLDDTVVNVHYWGQAGTWDNEGLYENGILAMGGADDEETPDWSWTEMALFKGKAPHITIKGQFIEWDGEEEWVDVGTYTMKQKVAP